MKHLLLSAFVFTLGLATAQTPSLRLDLVKSGLGNISDIGNCGDELLYVVDQRGIIRSFNPYDAQSVPKRLLDISSKVKFGGEEGLLGLAFDPNYIQTGRFYVYYVNLSGNLTISRFITNLAEPDSVDPSGEQVILNINHPGNTNHNGGCLRFGSDGYLYIGTGDGGGSGDPQNNAQNKNSMLGKMLRINVNEENPYSIPADNPFASGNAGLPEIWSYGLRNPWRFSFDRLSGDLWIADVGQNRFEEVNFRPAGSQGGENYGWKCYEGSASYSSCDVENHTLPVFEYEHNGGACSITGGYVYRGLLYDDLYGRYFAADYCRGEIWSITKDEESTFTAVSHGIINQLSNFTTFGEDSYGELYIARQNGQLYRIGSQTGKPRVVITAGNNEVLCAGDSVLLQAPFHPKFNYQWRLNNSDIDETSPWFYANEGGNYSVIVSVDGESIESNSIEVQYAGEPDFVLENQQEVYCIAPIPVTLNFLPSGGTISGPGISGNQFYTFDLEPGQIEILYTYVDSNQCEFTAGFILDVDICGGIGDIVAQEPKVFPNPFSDYLNFSLPATESCIIRIFNSTGQEVYLADKLNQAQGILKIDLSTVQSGIYLLQIELPTGISSRRIVKL